MIDAWPHNPQFDLRSLEDIELPKGSSLYLAGGVPQIFCQMSGSRSDDEAWLYLPHDILRSQLESHQSEDCSKDIVRCGSLIPVEESRVVAPIIIADRIVAVVDGHFDRSPHDEPWFRQLIELFIRIELQGLTRNTDKLQRQLTGLLEPYVTVDGFSRGLLNILIAQVPDGLAALYDESEGLYRLRTAVGNIAMWDVLDGALTLSQASRWLNAIRSGQHYLSAGFLPDHPTFLSAPPAFLFVHPGLKCSGRSRLLVMPVNGDLSREVGQDINIIASFGAMLNEDQFGAVEEIHAICRRLRAPIKDGRSFDEMLSEIFDLVGARTGLSRLVYVHENGHASAVVRRAHSRPAVRKESPPTIARSVIEAAKAGRFLMEQASEPGLLTEDEAKRYYLDNVKAELCFRLPGAEDTHACIAFGTYTDHEVLKRHERMLEVVAMVLHFYRRLHGSDPSVAAQCTVGQPARSMESIRAATAYRLIEGYFHSAFEALAYVIGQSELSAASPDPQRANLGSTIDAGRTAAEEVEQIRTILRNIADAGNQPISVSKVLRELPECFRGLIHMIQDRKNIALRLTIGRRHERIQQITTSDVYDNLYPAILNLFDEAICSGEITISPTSLDTADAIKLECPSEIIGHTTLAEILRSLYAGSCTHDRESNRQIIDCGQTGWTCDLTQGTLQRAWFVFNRTNPRVRNAGPQSESKRKPEIG